MNKYIKIGTFLAGMFVTTNILATNDDNPYLKAPETIRASNLWTKSWEVGYSYEHDASFDFTAKCKMKTRDDANLWNSFWANTGFNGAINTITLNGASSVVTEPLYKNKDRELVLSRTYLFSDVNQNLYCDASDAGIGGSLFAKLQNEGEFKEMVNKITDSLKTLCSYLKDACSFLVNNYLPEYSATTEVAGMLMDEAVNQINQAGEVGEWAEDYTWGKCSELGFERGKLDGKDVFKLNERSKASALLGKSAQIANIACEVSDEFNHGNNYLVYSDPTGKTSGYNLTSSNAERFFPLLKEKGPSAALPILVPASSIANSTFARESFGYCEQLFGSKERVIGETWVANADFMNSFLHPNLKGKFEGRIILSYEGDVSTTDKWGTSFKAKKIVMKEKLNNMKTMASYKEDNFRIDLIDCEKSSIIFYVEEDFSVVRKAEIKIESGAMRDQNMPDHIFTRGILVDGYFTCTMEYNCRKAACENN